MNDTVEKKILYVKDVAAMLGVTRCTIYTWEKLGYIKSRTLPSGRRYYLLEDVEKLLNKKGQ